MVKSKALETALNNKSLGSHEHLKKRLFSPTPHVEATIEAKRQVEFDFGQTQALEHHNAEFNELLEKLPGNNLLAQATHIDHYLSSLSELLPAELAEKYDTPRQTVEDEHAA